jgi:drug/metabolite transporter (DMT)-like permease
LNVGKHMMAVRDRIWGSASLLLCSASLFWALNPIVARAVHHLVSPLGMAFWRWVVAMGVGMIFAWPHLVDDRREILREWKMLALLGIGAFALVVYWGLQYTTATNNLMMQGAMPSMILLLSTLVFRDKITPGQLVGTLVSLAGLLVIVAQGSMANLLAMTFNRGDAAALFGVFLYSLYSTLLRKRPAIHQLSFLVTLFGVGAASIALPYSLEIAQGHYMAARAEVVLAILYVGIFPSLLAYFFFNRSVDLIGISRASIYMNLPPIFGVGLAILLLGERLAPFHLVGAVLVASGVFLATRRGAEASPTVGEAEPKAAEAEPISR